MNSLWHKLEKSFFFYKSKCIKRAQKGRNTGSIQGKPKKKKINWKNHSGGEMTSKKGMAR
jgi:hypothetical protein